MKTLIVLEDGTTHKSCQMKKKIKECETALSVLQSDLIWRLQPLDISINKVHKQSLRKKYVGYWIGKNNIKVSKSTICEWIDEL